MERLDRIVIVFFSGSIGFHFLEASGGGVLMGICVCMYVRLYIDD